MTLYAEDLITDVRQTLSDEGSTKRWEDSDLMMYLNEAIRTIALLKPDATAKTDSVQLAAGTRQMLPADGLRLLKVTRNMGIDGNTPGTVVKRADENTLALFKPDWHTQDVVAAIRNYLYDDRDPKVYWVEPPSDGAGYAEIVYSHSPAALAVALLNFTTPAVVVPLDDVYSAPLKAWMLRCAFGTEINSLTSQNLSVRYEQGFAQMLGLKWRVDMFVSPNKQTTKSAEVLQ